MSNGQSIRPTPSTDILAPFATQRASAAEQAILDVLSLYFSNEGVKNTFAMLSKSTFVRPDVEEGWVPVAFLASFKRVQPLISSPLDISRVARAFASSHLEVSGDELRIRRMVPFDAQPVEMPKITTTTLEAVGFPSGTTLIEVRTHFGQFGATDVERYVKNGSDCFKVTFGTVMNLVRALAQQHNYEDCTIEVTPCINMTVSQQPSSKNVPADPMAYKLNRVWAIGPINDLTSKSSIETVLSKYADISLVDIPMEHTHGHIRFKKPVAKELATLLRNNEGGLFVDGEEVPFRVIEGEEERLYWEVWREREAKAPQVHPAKPVHRRGGRKHKGRLASQVGKRAAAKIRKQQGKLVSTSESSDVGDLISALDKLSGSQKASLAKHVQRRGALPKGMRKPKGKAKVTDVELSFGRLSTTD
ncbi:hypothetical protein BJ742DRAFT_6290 [Cladochytrium replicatum]|nr:hypothetical protein BJ742DRAFT_6290 [Cladochytrium replicatum]